jgi:hypothetical protein
VTPYGEKNTPGPLKLLVLREKTCKNNDFDFAQITLNILVYVFTSSWGRWILRVPVRWISTLNGFSDTCHANKIHDRVNSNLLAVQPRAREIRIS